MNETEKALRAEIVTRGREMHASGINQSTSGNISARLGNRMLITPSATLYEHLEPDMIALLSLDDQSGASEGPLEPSTEWRIHHALLRSRADAGAVVHAHATYCTTLAIARKEIPPCHYMIAAFGGNNVRCSGYATFGTEALSRLVLAAMKDRTACLLANHGMIAIGESLPKAIWRTVELETIARQYYLSLSIGGPVLLDDDAVAETVRGFSSYGSERRTEYNSVRNSKRRSKSAISPTSACAVKGASF